MPPDANPPVIDSLVADKATIQPGDTATVTCVAHDADNGRLLHVTVTVTDASGGTGTATVPVSISDPLTYTWTCDDPTVALAPSADGTTCRVTA